MFQLNILGILQIIMQAETELDKYSQLAIQINTQDNFLELHNHKPQLTYLVVSTEPGRKIYYPPSQTEKSLLFYFESCQGISLDCEGYCGMGFNSGLTQMIETVQRKPKASILQKAIYISKINIIIKPTSVSNLAKSQKYHFNLSVLPPQDITAEEIQEFLQKIISWYGTLGKVDVKRNCLIVSFSQDISIKQYFIVKGIKQDDKKFTLLTYWAITTHRTLYTYQPSKLIQLPAQSRIKQFLIHSQWVIISTLNQVIFLHLYRPTHHFLNIPDIKVQGIYPMEGEKIIIFQHKYLHIYQLFTHKNPHLLGKAKTKKIQPYTVAFKKKTALFGGINFSAMMNQPTQEKEIHVIQNFTTSNLVNKHFLPDKTLNICKKKVQTPIKNLKHLVQSDMFICSCGQSIYLFHLQSSSMIASVDLASMVKRIYEIDYPIGIVSFLVKAKQQKHLIRISFEQYGQIVGTQVSNVQKYGDSVDFFAQGKFVYSSDGDLIVQYDQDKSKVLYSRDSQQQKIIRISVFKDSFGFLVRKENILQAYFVQL